MAKREDSSLQRPQKTKRVSFAFSCSAIYLEWMSQVLSNIGLDSSTNLRGSLRVSIEPDIHLSDNDQIHFDSCLSHLCERCHLPLALNCSLRSLSSLSNGSHADRESIRLSHYLRVRQPRKFYWMRNIQKMYLTIRLPTDRNENVTAELIEIHSCQRLPSSARTRIQQIKPVLLVYHVDEHRLKLNLRGDNCLLQLFFSSATHSFEEQYEKGIYYKWSDEGHIRSSAIRFEIDYATERDHSLVWSDRMVESMLNLLAKKKRNGWIKVKQQ